MKTSSSSKTKGFTLIELLVVVSIIGMLASITLVALASAKDKANIARGQTFHSGLFHRFGVDAILDMPLNDYSSGTAQASDQSVYGYKGTLTGGSGVNWALFPSINSPTNSIYFDGNTSGYVLLPKIDAKVTDKLTISAWIYPTDALEQYYRHGIAGNGTNIGFQMSLKTGQLVCQFKTGTGEKITFSGTIQSNKWQQVACIYDGAEVHSVINGVEVNKSTFAGGNLLPSSLALIGMHTAGGGAQSFKGYINDVKIYAAAP